jgi:hypothetical protein
MRLRFCKIVKTTGSFALTIVTTGMALAAVAGFLKLKRLETTARHMPRRRPSRHVLICRVVDRFSPVKLG